MATRRVKSRRNRRKSFRRVKSRRRINTRRHKNLKGG